MNTIKSFAVIGGDKRQLYCARAAADDGYAVNISGFEKCEDTPELHFSDIDSAIENSDAVILPLPVSKDGKTLFAPFSAHGISIEKLFSKIEASKPVFCGLKGKTPDSYFAEKKCFFYGCREDFAAANAVPTAEGAIAIAMENSDITINGSSCLVTGYGRIGRVLSLYLKGLGANVTVSARQDKDLELIKAAGMKAVRTNRISGHFDFIFNTVPALVFDRKTLAASAGNAVIIDLASLPGGIDKETADNMSIPVFHALSLPGKVAPKTAGIIIKNAICNIIGEDEI